MLEALNFFATREHCFCKRAKASEELVGDYGKHIHIIQNYSGAVLFGIARDSPQCFYVLCCRWNYQSRRVSISRFDVCFICWMKNFFARHDCVLICFSFQCVFYPNPSPIPLTLPDVLRLTFLILHAFWPHCSLATRFGKGYEALQKTLREFHLTGMVFCNQTTLFQVVFKELIVKWP